MWKYVRSVSGAWILLLAVGVAQQPARTTVSDTVYRAGNVAAMLQAFGQMIYL
jgi:hypothetical protein